MEWLHLIPIPILLGVVLYVNFRLEGHEQSCPIQRQIEVLNHKVDLILEHLLNNKR